MYAHCVQSSLKWAADFQPLAFIFFLIMLPVSYNHHKATCEAQAHVGLSRHSKPFCGALGTIGRGAEA